MRCYQTHIPATAPSPLPGLTETGQTPTKQPAILLTPRAPPEKLRNLEQGAYQGYSWEENFYHPSFCPFIVWNWYPSVPCLALLSSQLSVLRLVLLKGKGQLGCDIWVWREMNCKQRSRWRWKSKLGLTRTKKQCRWGALLFLASVLIGAISHIKY